jgi:hypothetical protein
LYSGLLGYDTVQLEKLFSFYILKTFKLIQLQQRKREELKLIYYILHENLQISVLILTLLDERGTDIKTHVTR